MSENKSKNEIFESRSFWLKLRVDYDEALETAQSNSIDLSEELLNRFIRRKQKVIKSRYDSIQEFKSEIRASPTPDTLLSSIYAESLWMKNWSEGKEFGHIEDSIEELIEDLDTDVDYEDINDEFGIIWPTETRVRREKKDGEVIGTRPTETNPIVVKKTDSGITIGTSSASRSDAVDELHENEDIEEIQPDSASEPVTGKVQNFLSTESEEFKIIGVKFNGSELPERSRISVKNERAIYDDLDSLDSNHIISTSGISDIQKIFLKDNRYGGKYRVKVIHGNDGFRFELESPDKLEKERQKFKQRFTNQTEIKFGVIYEYSSQNQAHLFNRTLSGEGEAYDRYFEELDDQHQQIVKELTDVSRQTLKICLNPDCRVENREQNEACIECSGREFSNTYEKTNVDLNENRFAALIDREISTIRPDPGNADISGWVTSKVSMNSRKVVCTDFQATNFVERGSSTSTNHQVFFVPQGNRRRPSTVDDYLLKCVYVTFGDSAVADYEGFGRISLHELLTSDSPSKLVGKALHDAITGTRTRTFRKSINAYEESEKYLEILGSEDALTKYRDELEAIYDPNRDAYFEKQLFYLLKGLFSQSERWGRTGEKEADGLLVIPRSDSRTAYAGKYDAKLSHREDGYDLGTEEEDQAARYMTNSSEVKALRAKTGDPHPTSHLLISQNFNENDFPRISKGVQRNLSEFSEEERPDLVFMEFDAVVGLYELESNHHQALDNPSIKDRFRELTISELTNYTIESGQEYTHFNQDSVRRIRDGLLSTIDQYDLETVKPYSS